MSALLALQFPTMKHKKYVRWCIWAASACSALCLSGCADKVSLGAAAALAPVGFWFGLWHGFILIPSWLISFFSDDVTIYAIYNNGGWYNSGFVIGVFLVFAINENRRG